MPLAFANILNHICKEVLRLVMKTLRILTIGIVKDIKVPESNEKPNLTNRTRQRVAGMTIHNLE